MKLETRLLVAKMQCMFDTSGFSPMVQVYDPAYTRLKIANGGVGHPNADTNNRDLVHRAIADRLSAEYSWPFR